MTEKEKMINGKLYDSFLDGLFEERQYAKDLVFEFNSLSSREIEKRNEILKKLLGKTGKNFYSNYNLTILDCAKVKIGDNVMIAPNVGLYTAGHPIDKDLRNSGKEYAFPITIGNDVWIGGNVVINPNVTIGSNVVIGSGSVVTKDIPSNVIAAGNPCKVIREITKEDKKYYFKKLKVEE